MTGLFEGLYGNAAIKREFGGTARGAEELDRRSSSAHAYIFEGPPGSGKHTAARLAAAAVAGEKLRGRVLDGITPDVTVTGLAKDRKTIGVETVRAIKEEAFLKPTELDCRVFIVENAETLTPQAQNAFLKLLEEPPRGVYFFLLCDNSASLLPTVRSRAPVLRMQLFSEEELEKYLLSTSKKARNLSEKDPGAFHAAIRGAGGRIGAALDSLGKRAEDAKYRALTDSIIDALADGGRTALLLRLGELPSKREELSALTEYLSLAVRDLVAAKHAPSATPLYYADAARAEELSDRLPTLDLLRADDALEEAYHALSRNANLSLTGLRLINGLFGR